MLGVGLGEVLAPARHQAPAANNGFASTLVEPTTPFLGAQDLWPWCPGAGPGMLVAKTLVRSPALDCLDRLVFLVALMWPGSGRSARRA